MPLMLSEPVLRLDEARARRNIARMQARARMAGVVLRPHFKTHQSQTVGRWFREAGIDRITVSSLAMAEYFAADGWDDITLAFPFHPGMTQRADVLAKRLRFGIVLADLDGLGSARFAAPVDLWLKMDVGSRRTGFEAEDLPALTKLIEGLDARPELRLRGLLAHAGHSYAARGVESIAAVEVEAMARLQAWRAELSAAAGRPLELSVGDTPGCAIGQGFEGASELRPGNFVFFDLSQWQIGSCTVDEIAVAMACPIVARHPRRGRLVVHGGAVHFSKDWMELDGQRVFGLGVEANDQGWGALRPELRLVALSQEHGQVEAPPGFIEACRPGEVLHFLPVHSCLTADCMGWLQTLKGRRLPMLKAQAGAG